MMDNAVDVKNAFPNPHPPRNTARNPIFGATPLSAAKITTNVRPVTKTRLAPNFVASTPDNNIATAIVGTSDDVRDLIVYWLDGGAPEAVGEAISGEEAGEVPSLLEGWRGELVGHPLHDIFTGRKALRVIDPLDDMPLGLCDTSEKELS